MIVDPGRREVAVCVTVLKAPVVANGLIAASIATAACDLNTPPRMPAVTRGVRATA